MSNIINELYEVYDKINDIECLRQINDFHIEQVARLCIQTEKENILIESYVVCSEDIKDIYLTGYSYLGDIQDYNCENEIGYEFFKSDISDALSVKEVMLKFACKLTETQM